MMMCNGLAGVAAAKDNAQGVVGLAPGARLWAIKVLDSSGIGSSSDIIKGIDYVTEHANEIDVVNLRLGLLVKMMLFITQSSSLWQRSNLYRLLGMKEWMPQLYFPHFPQIIAVSAIVDTDGKCGGISSITTTAIN